MSDRAWLASVCASELGTMLVFSNFSAFLGRTMALQSSIGFACGALGPAAFGAMLDWAPRLGTSSDGKWIFAFGLLGLFALAGPLAVGFGDARVAPRGAAGDTAT
jgi:MFS family permease